MTYFGMWKSFFAWHVVRPCSRMTAVQLCSSAARRVGADDASRAVLCCFVVFCSDGVTMMMIMVMMIKTMTLQLLVLMLMMMYALGCGAPVVAAVAGRRRPIQHQLLALWCAEGKGQLKLMPIAAQMCSACDAAMWCCTWQVSASACHHQNKSHWWRAFPASPDL